MLTTENPRTGHQSGHPGIDPQLRIAALVGVGCVIVGGVAAGLGGVVSGAPAAYGAAIGAALMLGIFVSGALAVFVVARVMPALSLLVALLTYACQVLLACLVFVRLDRSGLLDDGTLDARWLAAVLVGCTLLWVAAQILVAAKSRTPIYDLPEAGDR